MRGAGDWSMAKTLPVRDPFGGSSGSFHPTGESGVTALWLAAGQDGQQVYWLTKGPKGLRGKLEPCLKNTTPPIFAPQGDEFLVVHDPKGVSRYRFPAVRRLGVCRWPWGGRDAFGTSLCYLEDAHALVSSNEGRFFLLDVGTMSIVEEVAIENHEPRPAEVVYYPQLGGDKTLCTDISFFRRVGAVIMFVVRRDRGIGLRGWKDSMLWVPVRAVLDAVRA